MAGSTDKAAPRALRQAKAARAAAEGPQLTVVRPAEPVVAGPLLKKKDIVDRASEKSGVKKKDARLAVEAALDVLAEALLEGAELALPPLGKIKVVKSKPVNGGKVLTLKVRVTEGGKASSGKDPLAEAED